MRQCLKKAVFLFCLWVIPCFADTLFIVGSDDVPLMEGLITLSDLDMSFDAPEGRIIQSVAYSDSLLPEQVKKFYAETLPQLGWKQEGKEYFREKEALSIESYQLKGKTTVRFELKSN